MDGEIDFISDFHFCTFKCLDDDVFTFIFHSEFITSFT